MILLGQDKFYQQLEAITEIKSLGKREVYKTMLPFLNQFRNISDEEIETLFKQRKFSKDFPVFSSTQIEILINHFELYAKIRKTDVRKRNNSRTLPFASRIIDFLTKHKDKLSAKTIVDLPRDVSSIIFQHLNDKDVSSLKMTSKSFYETFSELEIDEQIHHALVDLNKQNAAPNPEKFNRFCDRLISLWKGQRKLSIKVLTKLLLEIEKFSFKERDLALSFLLKNLERYSLSYQTSSSCDSPACSMSATDVEGMVEFIYRHLTITGKLFMRTQICCSDMIHNLVLQEQTTDKNNQGVLSKGAWKTNSPITKEEIDPLLSLDEQLFEIDEIVVINAHSVNSHCKTSSYLARVELKLSDEVYSLKLWDANFNVALTISRHKSKIAKIIKSIESNNAIITHIDFN